MRKQCDSCGWVRPFGPDAPKACPACGEDWRRRRSGATIHALPTLKGDAEAVPLLTMLRSAYGDDLDTLRGHGFALVVQLPDGAVGTAYGTEPSGSEFILAGGCAEVQRRILEGMNE